jgi:mannose-6-phosphate isomerase-like protein (cupin superfamily)
MRMSLGSLVALAAAAVLTISLGDVLYGQSSRPRDCAGVDSDCAFSSRPVPGVRIVRLKHYPRRPADYMSGDRYTTLAEARETRNQFAMFDFYVPPGSGPFAHTHSHEWETFFVVQGTVNFITDVAPDGTFTTQALPPGTAVYAPQCRVMGFRNIGSAPARVLTLAMPAGLDNFFHVVGEEVVYYDAPIPSGPDQDELMRLAFWGEQRAGMGDTYIPGGPPPDCPTAPAPVISSITDRDRRDIGPFGYPRVRLVKQQEVGNTTSATAFCGFGPPGRPGGTVEYSHLTLPIQNDFPPFETSQNTEVFYTLDGTLSFLFNDQKRVHVEPLSYIEIQPNVAFSIANLSQGWREQPGQHDRRAPKARGQALAISIIGPDCQQAVAGNP